MRINRIKFLVIFFLFFIIQNNTANSAIFKFNNLEKARKIYPTDPVKAHNLLDKTIKHYIKKPNKDWPWLGYAYSDKAHFLKTEGKKKLALEFRSKACEIQEGDFKKRKLNIKKQDLIQCYYSLSTLLNDNDFQEKSLKIATKAINIFEEFKNKNYQIHDFAGPKQYAYQIVQRARTYKDLFKYEKSIIDYEKYLEIVSVSNTNQLGSNDYLSALSEIEFLYSTIGDFKTMRKYLNLRYEIIQQYSVNNIKLQSRVNRDMASSLKDLKKYKEAINYYNKSIRFAEKGISSSIDYQLKLNFLQDMELSLMGKFDSEQSEKRDKDKYIILYEKLYSINEQKKILDKSTLSHSIIDTYYTLSNDYEGRKKNLDNAKNLVDRQIEEAIKTDDFRLDGFYSSKRLLLFDEAWNDLDLENYNNALLLANELKEYETLDQGIREIKRKVELRNLFGRIYSGLGNFKKAIDNYLLALEILNNSFEKDLENENTILNNLALAYSNIGETDLANKYIDLAKSRDEKINQDPIYLVTQYNNKASLTLDEKEYLDNANKAYEIFQNSDPQNKNSTGFVNTINLLGNFYIQKGNYEKDKLKKKEHYTTAKNYYLEALVYVEKEMIKNIFPYIEFLHNYSDLLSLADNNYDGCINYLTKASNKIEELNPQDRRLIRNYQTLWACHYKKDEMEKSFDYLFKIMMIILNEFDQQNFNLKFNNNFKSISMYKDTVHSFFIEVIKNSHKNIELLNSYRGLDFLDLIFTLQQVVKSNKLSAKLSESITRQISKDENVSSDLKKYISLTENKNELLKIETINPEKIKKRNQKINELNRKIEDLKTNIEKNYPEIKKNYANQVVTGGLLQQNIAQDEALIQYSVGTFNTYATIITSENYTVQRVNLDNKQLSELIKKVRDSLELQGGKPIKFALSESQKLYELLLGKMNDLIKDKKKLIIVPDGPLYGIPFELFHDKKNDEWLVEKFAVSISPSVYSYVALNYNDTLKFNTGNSFIGFGDPVIKDKKITESNSLQDILELEFSKIFTRGGNINLKYLKMFPELPETALELKRISKKFDKNSKIYLKEDFNEEVISKINFNDYKVVSFASHALVVGEIDGLSEPSIVLSLPKKITPKNDGLLTASEIIKLKINSDLVILSACNTAASDGDRNSEALSGLANSFFYSGAKSLLVTHWSVISDTSVDLMTDTFDLLNEKDKDLSIALMKSKIKMLNNSETSHPIYWAPYTLVGRTSLN